MTERERLLEHAALCRRAALTVREPNSFMTGAAGPHLRVWLGRRPRCHRSCEIPYRVIV